MSLFTPEFGLVFWMLVVFLILFGILAKYAWPAIVRMMDERADFIDKGVEYAREAKRDREKAQEDAKDLLTEARKQQLEVLQQTERLKREMIAEARKAAENDIVGSCAAIFTPHFNRRAINLLLSFYPILRKITRDNK